MSDVIDLGNDSLFKLARGTLWFCGAAYGLLSLCVPASLIIPLMVEGASRPEELSVVGAMSVAVALVVGACAIGNFVAAWGLGKRKKWAWVVTIVIGGLYAPSGCLPFGALLLYAMLRSGVKEAYDADAARLTEPVSF